MTDQKLPDVYIAIPSGGDWKREFGASMVGLVFHLAKMKAQGKIKGFRFDNHSTSNLPKLRQRLLDNALASGCTHILWIDDDTHFPPDAIEVMLERKKPWLVVNICKKMFGENGGWIARYDGGEVVNSKGKSGIEKIGTMGLGMVLIELDAIRSVQAPHFEMVWMDEKRGYLGEDLYFLLKCRQETGVEIWVDHDISNCVSHVGNHGYGASDLMEMIQKASQAA